MTMASTISCELSEPTGIHRAARQLGRALVAWGERPVRPAVVASFDGTQQLAAERLLNDRALSIANRGTLLF